MRVFVVLLCLALAACSPQVEPTFIGAYVPPSAPTLAAVSEGINKAAMEEKLTGFIEMSDLRQSDHGPGRFVLCIRGTGSESGPRRTHAVLLSSPMAGISGRTNSHNGTSENSASSLQSRESGPHVRPAKPGPATSGSTVTPSTGRALARPATTCPASCEATLRSMSSGKVTRPTEQRLARSAASGAARGATTAAVGVPTPDSKSVIAIADHSFEHALPDLKGGRCQSAFKFDPASASNFDPLGRRVLAVALAPSELAGVAETVRARAA
jgi:hypothetical protein